jgi:Asp-tRNA(Asn)/Glu-tRNA(Gln) amidotransferase A subunit family amidase
MSSTTPFRACFLATLFAGFASAAEPAQRDVEAVVRWLGLPFSPEETTQLNRSAAEFREAIDSVRAHPVDPSRPQALVFRPWARIPDMPDGFRWKPPTRVPRPADVSATSWSSVAELSALIRSRVISSEALTRHCLQRLRQHDPTLHAVVQFTEERALEAARRADTEIRAGKWRGPLHGIPYGAKDLFDVQGLPTSWGVAHRTNTIATRTSTVIQRLDEAGAVLVAKLSLGELAMGDVWHGGKTRNPWNTAQGSSGSSAGSAAAVAAGLVPFALGTETLGSIVSPATVCSVTGLRPTFGRVPRTGAMMLCPSLDKIGPITRSAEDCALVFAAIHGPDAADPAAVRAGFRWDSSRSIRGLRVGILRSDLENKENGSPRHVEFIEALQRLGVRVQDTRLPSHPREPLHLILAAESSASFEPWVRDPRARQLVQQDSWNWPNQFRAARVIPAVEYLEANHARSQLAESMEQLLQQFDALLAPPWSGDALLFSNFSGHPCVVLPAAPKTGDRPNTLCLIGRWFDEETLLRIARAVQDATPWHRNHPPGY